MPLEAIPYLDAPTVHGLCRSGHHKQCKKFEDWNLKARFPCACPECDHPFPPREERTLKVVPTPTVDSPKPTEVLSAAVETSDDPTTDTEEETHAMATATKDDTKSTKANGRGRGELESQVLDIAERYEDGKITLDEGKSLTPHFIAKTIAEEKGLEKPPSTGAVAAVIKRWEDYGFALTDEKPYAFRRRSANGKKQGLEALKQKHRDRLKAERAAKKAAESE